MKRGMIVLALIGVFVGLAQAQTTQVRKVFSHKIDNWVVHLSLDTLAGKPMVMADLWYGYHGATSKLVVFDSAGERLNVPGGGSGFPEWARRTSRSGRYFASLQPGGTMKRMDKRGNLLPSFSRSINQVLLVSDDGSRWLAITRHPAVHGGRDAPRMANVEDDPSDTLLLFNGQGSVLAVIPAPGLSLAEFSPKDNWLFLRYKHVTGRKNPLACYDSNGNRMWYKEVNFSYPMFKADSLNNLCVLEWRDSKTVGLAFYFPNGQEQAFVPLVEKPNTIQFSACGLELTKDGKYAVFNADKRGLFYVQKVPPQILWTWKREPYPYGHLIKGFALSETGEYVVADVNDVNQRWGHLYLFNNKGEVVWQGSDIQKAKSKLTFGLGKYFTAFTGSGDPLEGDVAVTLFEVESKGGVK